MATKRGKTNGISVDAFIGLCDEFINTASEYGEVLLCGDALSAWADRHECIEKMVELSDFAGKFVIRVFDKE